MPPGWVRAVTDLVARIGGDELAVLPRYSDARGPPSHTNAEAAATVGVCSD